MTRLERMQAFIANHHKPDGWKANMVYSLWEDGEITLEKGGELFGWRTLHSLVPGTLPEPWPVELFPVKNSAGTHGRIYFDGDKMLLLKEMQKI